MCSGCTSFPSAGQYIFCFSGTLSWSCSVRKCSRFSRTAVNSRTGMVTRPKLIDPDQMGREEPFSISHLDERETWGVKRETSEGGRPAFTCFTFHSSRFRLLYLLDHFSRALV